MTFSAPNALVGFLADRAAAKLERRVVQVSNAMRHGSVPSRPGRDQFLGYPEFEPATPAPRLRAVAWTGNLLVSVFLLGFGIWSVFAPLESAAIASGVVEPETSRKTIQHLEGGIVRQILVRNGDVVSSGQVLIRLDDIKPRTEGNRLSGQLWDAKARQARLLSEQAEKDHIVLSDEMQAAASTNPAVQAILAGQEKIFETRKEVARSEIVVIQKKMAQIQEEMSGFRRSRWLCRPGRTSSARR